MRQWCLAVFLLLPWSQLAWGQQSSNPEEKNQPKTWITWKDGKTSFNLGNAHLELSNRLQFRFTLVDDNVKQTTGSFRIRRFKTKLEGWAYTKDLTFELQLNWADDKPLEDANVAYDFSHGKKRFVLKAGQFKVPFGRQALTSSGSLLFVDRSIVTDRGVRLRDIGMQVSGFAWERKLDWCFAVFNGAGRNVTTNDNSKLQYNARVTLQPWGEVKYWEVDFERRPKPRLAVSAQYELNDRRGPNTHSGPKLEAKGVDMALVWRGLSFFTYGYREKQTPAAGRPFFTEGFTVEMGYLFPSNHWQLAGRWATLDPSDQLVGDLRTEKGLALGYFLNRHAHKLQMDVRHLKDHRSGIQTWEFRTQYQVIF